MIAVIQGNKLYENSLVNLTNKHIDWFNAEHTVKTADKFNHVLLPFMIGLLGNIHRLPQFARHIQKYHYFN